MDVASFAQFGLHVHWVNLVREFDSLLLTIIQNLSTKTICEMVDRYNVHAWYTCI